MIDFGERGRFFLHTSYGDIAETDDVIALELGLLHSLTGSPLSAQQLLDHDLVSSSENKADRLRRNSLFQQNGSPVRGLQNARVHAATLTLLTARHSCALTAQGLTWRCSIRWRWTKRRSCNTSFSGMPWGRTPTFSTSIACSPVSCCIGEQAISSYNRSGTCPEPGAPVFKRVDPHSIGALYAGLEKVIGAHVNDMVSADRAFSTMLSGESIPRSFSS